MRYKHYDIKNGVKRAKSKLAITFSVLGLGVGGVIGSIAIFGSAHAISTPVTVTAANPQGWAFFDDNGNGGSGSFVNGPGTPPLGAGSAELSVSNSAQGYALGTAAYAGTPLSQITNLRYSSYQPGPTLAIALQFDVKYRTTDTSYDGRLVYEPYQNGSVTVGSGWQTWNPLNGIWWASHQGVNGTDGLCPISSPCSWSTIISDFPDATISGGTVFKAGSGWSSFTGNVDAFTVGVNGNDTTYNFEKAVAAGTITSPAPGQHVSGTLHLAATYSDGDVPNTDDAVQWAVRQGTCAAGTNTVFGNVDGHHDSYNWDGNNFSATLDASFLPYGQYCFVFNPSDDPGQPNVRETQNFYIDVGPPASKDQCKGDGWKTFNVPEVFKNQGQCVKWTEAKAHGTLHMSNPSQKIEFSIANVTKTDADHDRDDHNKNTVTYWNYDYPGVLHYTANVLCTNVNTATDEARFMFQIPPGHPGLSGIYVVAYVKHVKHGADLYGHAATSDLAAATQWCQTGNGFTPTMYTVTNGRVWING